MVRIKLEKYLVLNKYFLKLLGFDDIEDLREILKDKPEGYEALGRSYFADALIGCRIPDKIVLEYDRAIREYSYRLRKNRREPKFNLKYFQYLAVLFCEIFLDKFCNDKTRFLNELNSFIEDFNATNRVNFSLFSQEELKKVAFWMATGSGKTFIMHINYWQILKYSRNKWDNIILITPNEGLSKQHYDEMSLSGIPCRMYDGNVDNLKTSEKEVLIIDIYKLTGEKKGEGKTVDISYFDGKNLVFVDEGHKGQKSEEQKWKNLRERIGKNGFIFEYSATFEQVIGNNKDLLEEYSKAILFDYSYKYFYKDGYGKDFYVYNIVEEEYTKNQRDMLLTAGLLSYYEQLLLFEKHQEELREHQIEKPLMIFVGSKVSGKGLESDVVKVIQFLDKVLKNGKFLERNTLKILNGKSGLTDEKGNDIFKDKFRFIGKHTPSVNSVYQKIFDGSGNLELYEIKNADGEIGLKTRLGEKYFGVVNVGDVSSLKKLIKESQIQVKEDHLSSSLFFRINKPDSSLNILIGSKKFVEGWNSWRVSSMGLINMGKGEGPQIIQLFGRGVRLKGREYSLKREENPSDLLKTLQTFHIYGLDADYINAFLAAIEKEEVDYEEIGIPIRFNIPERWENKVYTVKTKDDFDFLNYPVSLSINENIFRTFRVDLRPRITLAHGLEVGRAETAVQDSVYIDDGLLDLIQWDNLYLNIISHKISNRFFNLLIDKKVLRKIIESRKYRLYALPEQLEVLNFSDLSKIHNLCEMIIKEYIDRFYRKAERKRMMEYLELEPLVRSNRNMYPEDREIILKIPRAIVNEFKQLIQQINKYKSKLERNKKITEKEIPDIYKINVSEIPSIHFDRHLYAPLVVYRKGKENIKSIPVKLNKGETKFVEDLRAYVANDRSLFRNGEIFLLRNLSRRGVGFFISSGFYPDFIMWIKGKNGQKIIFIDPKGIMNLGNFNDEKIQLCTNFIRDIDKRVSQELARMQKKINLGLYAFILSVTRYDDIKPRFGDGTHSRQDFEDHNVLFMMEDKNYIDKIMKRIS